MGVIWEPLGTMGGSCDICIHTCVHGFPFMHMCSHSISISEQDCVSPSSVTEHNLPQSWMLPVFATLWCRKLSIWRQSRKLASSVQKSFSPHKLYCRLIVFRLNVFVSPSTKQNNSNAGAMCFCFSFQTCTYVNIYTHLSFSPSLSLYTYIYRYIYTYIYPVYVERES